MSNLTLDSIKVENYKSLVDTGLELQEGVTALIGINGSGKTNALSAIKLLRQLVNSTSSHMRYVADLSDLVTSEIIANFSLDKKKILYKGNHIF